MRLTKNESRYMKIIYRKESEGNGKFKTSSLAKEFGIKPASVTEVIQNLSEKGLLNYTPYQGAKLTERGKEAAEKQLRKHRILEFFLVNRLGYDPQEACKEALNLDYYASEKMINSICRSFNHPKTCPCGEEIFPARDKK